ncbi:ATP-dependent DNA ligase [Pseudomonas putida]|nr:ATP-dependent DNA ligase [Pseudomonas putida]
MFLKTSGGKGMHLVVPLTRRAGWDEVKDFSHALVEHMTGLFPDRLSAVSGPKNRSGGSSSTTCAMARAPPPSPPIRCAPARACRCPCRSGARNWPNSKARTNGTSATCRPGLPRWTIRGRHGQNPPVDHLAYAQATGDRLMEPTHFDQLLHRLSAVRSPSNSNPCCRNCCRLCSANTSTCFPCRPGADLGALAGPGAGRCLRSQPGQTLRGPYRRPGDPCRMRRCPSCRRRDLGRVGCRAAGCPHPHRRTERRAGSPARPQVLVFGSVADRPCAADRLAGRTASTGGHRACHPSQPIQADHWQAVGMAATASVAIVFDDSPGLAIGEPGQYLSRQASGTGARASPPAGTARPQPWRTTCANTAANPGPTHTPMPTWAPSMRPCSEPAPPCENAPPGSTATQATMPVTRYAAPAPRSSRRSSWSSSMSAGHWRNAVLSQQPFRPAQRRPAGIPAAKSR